MTDPIAEAPSVPCTNCGAALPVDPTHHWVWCLACHQWSPVPPDVHHRAVLYITKLQEAHQLARQHYQHAHVEEAVAEKKRRTARVLQMFLGFWVVMGLIGFVPSMIFYVVGTGAALYEEYELWSLVLAGLFLGLFAAIGFGFLLALGYVFWRRRKKHRRDVRGPGREGEYESSAMAICSVCGGAIAFHIGQTSITCSHCREVVVPAVGHKQQLVALALDRVQLAELEKARKQRQRNQGGSAREADADPFHGLRDGWLDVLHRGPLRCRVLRLAHAHA